MTYWKPDFSPNEEIIYNILMASSGQKTIGTRFRDVKAAIPMVRNASKYIKRQFNGFTVVHSAGIVDVFANCSGNDDSASGVLPNCSMRFDLLVYGTL